MAKTLFNYKFITAGDMTGNITSPAIPTTLLNGYSIYAEWTGTPVGTLKLQVKTLTTTDTNDFVDLSGSSTPVNGAGNFLWEVVTANYEYVRLVYTSGSSTGSIDATVCGKGEPQ